MTHGAWGQVLIRLSRGSAVYGLSDMLQKGVLVLLIPIYTRHMSPAEYGVVAVAMVVLGIVGIVLGFGLRAAIVREYYDYRGDPESLRRYIGTITIFVLVVGGGLAALLLLLGETFLGRMLADIPFWPIIALAVGAGFFQVTGEILKSLYRAREQARRYVALQLPHVGFMVLLILYFIVYRQEGAVGWMKGVFISWLILFGVSLFLLRKEARLTFETDKLRHALHFGVPIVPHLLAAMLLSGIDRIILQSLLPLHEVGLYALGYQAAMVLGLLASGINRAWTPIYYDTVRTDPDAPRTIAQVFTLYIAFMASLALVGMLFAREGTALVTGPDFHGAYVVIPAVILGAFFWGLYFMFVTPIFERRKTHWLAPLTISAGVVNVGFLYLLTPHFGLVGAAVATTIGYASLAAGALWLARRVYRIPYAWPHLVCTLAVLVTAAVVGQQAGAAAWWGSPLVRAAALFAGIALIGFSAWVARQADNAKRLGQATKGDAS